MKRVNSTAAPKHLLAEEAIRDAIQTGRYPPASRLPGEIELAKTLQVSTQTLQAALRRLCNQGLLERRPRVGTFVRDGRHAPNIAVLVFNESRIESSLSGALLDDMQAEATARGHSIRPMLLARPYPSLPQLRDELHAMRVGAVGMISFLDTDRDFIAGLSELMPCVLFNKGVAGLSLPFTGLDTFAAARLIVDYVVRRGRKRIAAGVFHMRHQRFTELNVALEAECLRQGLTVDRRLWAEGMSYHLEEGLQWLERLEEAECPPDALVACGNMPPEAIPEWAQRMGIQLGRDADYIPLRMAQSAREARSPWATLSVDDFAACLTGSRMLMDIIEGKPLSGDGIVRIAPELILPAGSCAGPVASPAEKAMESAASPNAGSVCST